MSSPGEIRSPPAPAPAIVSTVTAVPAYSATQAEVKARLRDVFDLPARRLDAAMELFDHAAVERRYSVEPIDQLGVRRSIGDIQERYREHAIGLGRKVARQALEQAGVAAADIDLIVTTSCTGIMIPSVDAYLVDDLGFRRDVRRLPITELGCAAGAAALARAHDFLVGFPDARALVIAVELPSLSMQRADLSPANLVSTALFGDGAAAAVLVGGGVATGTGGELALLETLSHIWPRSTYALGFDLKDDGFHTVLSKDIPALLKSEIAALVTSLAARRGLERAQLSSFVLHPGGRKILGMVEEELGLSRADTQPSWDVLRNYGNQSSASVLFVLDEWMSRRRPPAGTHGVLAAFGPGLTSEMLLLGWN
jgi:alkylresorcinol/alkylpyrone synthase